MKGANLAEVKKTKIFIAIPTTGNIRTELAIFLLGLNRQIYDVIVSFTIGGTIAHNRNKLVENFLKTDYEWFLFIDSDTVPPINILDMTKNGKDICSGVYHSFKGNKLRPLIFEKYKDRYKFIQKDNKDYLIEVDAVGTGCLLIHRNVFDIMKKPYFEFLYDEIGLVKLSEDLNFCKKAQKAGFKIWVDKRMGASHHKTIDLLPVWTMLINKKQAGR